MNNNYGENIWLFFCLIVIFLSVVLVLAIFRFIDLKRRKVLFETKESNGILGEILLPALVLIVIFSFLIIYPISPVDKKAASLINKEYPNELYDFSSNRLEYEKFKKLELKAEAKNIGYIRCRHFLLSFNRKHIPIRPMLIVKGVYYSSNLSEQTINSTLNLCLDYWLENPIVPTIGT